MAKCPYLSICHENRSETKNIILQMYLIYGQIKQLLHLKVTVYYEVFYKYVIRITVFLCLWSLNIYKVT